jgi:hypothetical protein
MTIVVIVIGAKAIVAGVRLYVRISSIFLPPLTSRPVVSMPDRIHDAAYHFYIILFSLSNCVHVWDVVNHH